MNIFSGLLFLHGHITDAALARRLASPVTTGGQSRPVPQPTPAVVPPAGTRRPPCPDCATR